MKLLIIEDDEQTADFIHKGMEERGYVVDVAVTGQTGLIMGTERSHDVIVLDRMLPGLDGIGLLKSFRALGIQTPILMLSAMGNLDDRVSGLEAGADDYLVKPFAFAELHARVMNLSKRASNLGNANATLLSAGDLEMDLLKREVRRRSGAIDLLATEFRLLEFLLRRQGQVVTKTMLLEGVWDFHFDPKTNVVETHISRLRAKIDLPDSESLIKTIRGAGYKLEV